MVNTIIVGDKMFKKIKLDYKTLAPVIDDKNLDLHYNKHYQKYIDNLNSVIGYYNGSVVDVINNIESFDKDKRSAILVNAGGVYNHELYFRSMNNKVYKNNNLVNDIIKQYGSYDNFKNKFIETANKMIGSGYTFLVLNDDKFDIVNLSNQDNPYSYNMIPLIALDLWEHAYYLTYYNDRAQYINNFFSIINFDYANISIFRQTERKRI